MGSSPIVQQRRTNGVNKYHRTRKSLINPTHHRGTRIPPMVVLLEALRGELTLEPIEDGADGVARRQACAVGIS
jgi:hypothetical protein